MVLKKKKICEKKKGHQNVINKRPIRTCLCIIYIFFLPKASQNLGLAIVGRPTSFLRPGTQRRLIAALVKKAFIRACVRTRRSYVIIGILHGGRSAGSVDSLREIAFVRSYYGFTRRGVVLLIIVSQRIRYVFETGHRRTAFRLRSVGLRGITKYRSNFGARMNYSSDASANVRPC